MAALNTAENLPERDDYSVSHRPPPAIPTIPYSSLPDTAPSELESVTSKRGRSRAGSLGQLFRLNSSTKTAQPQYAALQSGSTAAGGDLGGLPPLPNSPVAAVAASAPFTDQNLPIEAGRKDSFSTSRKISLDGRNMLRKSSRMRREEQERFEAERKARAALPPPSLPFHHPLPGIDTFGGETNTSTGSPTASPSSPNRATNFSRPNFAMPSSTSASSSSPAYAIRPGATSPPESGATNGDFGIDPYARTESMTHRGRYSYASSIVSGNVSSPRRIRRRKDPTPFNVLVIGAKNSGKTSFISLIRNSMGTSSSNSASLLSDPIPQGTRSSFTSHYVETEIEGERIGLTLWDSVGLEKNIVDLQLREMASFVESKFEDTFAEEQKVVRSPGVKDTHIHCVFLVLDPIRLDANVATSSAQQTNGANLSSVSGLDEELDLQVLRVLWGKTTVIPVIAKADTLTIGHMAFLKKAVWDSMKAARLDPLEALELEDDLAEEDEDSLDGVNGHDEGTDSVDTDSPPSKSRKSNHNRHSSISASINTTSDDEIPYIPMSVLSPDPYDLPPYNNKPRSTKNLTRRFAWGTADPFNAEHCDYSRLRDSIFVEWRGELRDLSRTKWYENWRTSRLKNVPSASAGSGRTQQRVKGGVTPVAAVPREGLSSPITARNFSPPAGSAVPRVSSAAKSPSPPAVSAAAVEWNGVDQRV